MINIYKKTVLALLLLLANISYSQSKKEIIEKLNYKIDSFKIAIEKDKNAFDESILELKKNNLKHLEDIEKLELKVRDLQASNNNLIKVNKENNDKINSLMFGNNNMFDYVSYDFRLDNEWINYEFDKIKYILDKKEERRIYNSKYTDRNDDLIINCLDGKKVNLKSIDSSHKQNHYVYLTENVLENKVYIVNLNLNLPGKGSVNYKLIEYNVLDGSQKELISGIGGEFSFSPNMKYLIVSGWHYVNEFLNVPEFKIVNLTNGLVELNADDAEITNVKWINDYEFSLVYNKISVEGRNWQDGTPPKLNFYLSGFAFYLHYKLSGGKWKLITHIPELR
jgi:hypothetical protein